MDVQNIYYNGRIKIPYTWYVGETGSRFLIALRDNKEIWGNQCPQCKKVFVPPMKSCGECFVPTGEWLKLADTGTVESFTVVHYENGVAKRPLPVIYGLIKIDGASGSLLHFIGDVKPEKVKIGMRVKAVFAEKRGGTILDISHFAPVKG